MPNSDLNTNKVVKSTIKEKEIKPQDEVSYVAIIGKGKKAKKVEISSANNLFDAISESDKATGVQLAFAF